MKKVFFVVLLGLLTLLLAYFFASTLSFENLKQQHLELQSLLEENSLAFLCMLVLALVLSSALPLPFVAVLCIASGAFFGFLPGLMIVQISCLIGAIICFTYVRFLAPKKFNQLYANKFIRLRTELARSSLLYATGFRCLPGVPFFVGNVILALSPISITAFAISTVAGMLPTFVILTLSGSRLHELNDSNEIFSINFIVITIIAFTSLVLIRLKTKKRAVDN